MSELCDSTTLNDPLIKDLKGRLLELHDHASHKSITDANSSLLPFCQGLEAVFRKGLRSPSTAVGIMKRDYWCWIESLPTSLETTSSSRLPDKKRAAFKTAVDATLKCTKLKTVQGRGRYFIRLALLNKIISVPVVLLMKNATLQKKIYDANTSILGDEILCEVMLSVLKETEAVDFNLDQKNSSFLDDTWLLPIYETYEFVPCTSLGIKIGYVRGRAMAVTVEEGSVAAEDDKIEVGDILDELYGESLHNCNRWKIPNLLRHNKGTPILVEVAKGHYPSGELYPPAASVMRLLHINVDKMQLKYRKKEAAKYKSEKFGFLEDDKHRHATEETSLYIGFRVTYLGSIYLGKQGRKEMITYGVSEVQKQNLPKQEVILETSETHVVVKDATTREVLFQHCYTMIGACGRPKEPQSVVAYTIGDTSCNISKSFSCFVYEASTPIQSRDILFNIAKGFERTHWAV